MSMESWLKRIGNEMLDLVYPPGLYCICCGKIIDDSRTYRLCNDCMRSMNWNTGRCCSRCGRPLADTDPGETAEVIIQVDARGNENTFTSTWKMEDSSGNDCFPSEKWLFEFTVTVANKSRESTEA